MSLAHLFARQAVRASDGYCAEGHVGDAGVCHKYPSRNLFAHWPSQIDVPSQYPLLVRCWCEPQCRIKKVAPHYTTVARWDRQHVERTACQRHVMWLLTQPRQDTVSDMSQGLHTLAQAFISRVRGGSRGQPPCSGDQRRSAHMLQQQCPSSCTAACSRQQPTWR